MMQMQFWWAINQLPSLKPSFSFLQFVFLVMLTMMLFVSAALLLPSRGEDEQPGLRGYFELDGRYALVALSAFLALGFVANIVFFGEPLTSVGSILDIPMIILPLVTFFAKTRSAYARITFLYVPLSVVDTIIALTS
jgi:hypothetical protein